MTVLSLNGKDNGNNNSNGKTLSLTAVTLNLFQGLVVSATKRHKRLDAEINSA